MLLTNSALADKLALVGDKNNWSQTIKTELTGGARRLRIWRDSDAQATNPVATGVEVLNVGLTGEITIVATEIKSVGVTGDTQIRLAADLLSGKSMLRIEGNGNWIGGTVGLTREAQLAAGITEANVVDYDFELMENLTTTSGIAFSSSFAIRPPRLLPSGTGPAAPTLTADAPHHINVKDGSGNLVGSFTFDAQRDNWVFDDPEMASNVGDVGVYQTNNPVTYGGFEFGATMWAMNAVVNSEVNAPLYEVAVVRVPVASNWPNWPSYSGYQEGVTDTFGPAFKVEICRADNTILHTHQMRDDLYINDPNLHDNHLYDVDDFPIRPHMHCAAVLPWRSHRPKRNTNSAKWMPGFKEDILRPKICRTHFSTNQCYPLYSFRNNVDGVGNFYLAPKWAIAAKNQSSDTPNLDPYSYNFNTQYAPYASMTYGALRVSGWGYEPGSPGIMDQLMAVGGSRHDRYAWTAPTSIYLTKSDYIRPRNNETIQELHDAWEFNMFNFPIFHVRNARTFETVPMTEAEQGLWTYGRGYYAPNNYYTTMERTIPSFAVYSGQTGDDTKPYFGSFVDKNGRMPFNGAALDQLHNYNMHSLLAMHFNSPMQAWATKMRLLAHFLCGIGDDGSENPTGGTHPYKGQLHGSFFLIRTHAWKMFNLASAWKLTSPHPEMGFSRKMLEDRLQRELEAVHDHAYVPTMVDNDQTIYFKSLRCLGVPMASNAGASEWYVDHHGLSFYMSAPLQLMRQTGLWNVMYNKSAKCRLALLFIIRCLDLVAVDYILDTDGRKEGYQVVKGANGPNADVYSSWAEWATANPKGHPDQDWITDSSGNKRSGNVWEQDIAQHFRYQYVCMRRDYFPDVPCERADGIALAIAKYKGWYDHVAAHADGGGNDWTWRWPGLGEFKAPTVLVP